MAVTLFNHRSSFVIIFLKRSIAIRSNLDLGNEMKLFNDNKEFNKVLQLFDKHNKNNEKIFSSLTLTQVLKACAQLGDIQHGKNIHNLVLSRIKHDHYILASLIHMYMQCSHVKEAESLFKTTPNKTLSMYGAMMKGYVHNNLASQAIDLFKEVKDPDEVNIIVLFNACAQLESAEALDLVKKVWKEIPNSFHSNSHLLTSLLDALMKCGDVKEAESLFKRTPKKRLSMYAAMMKGYVHNNLANQAIDLFKEVKDPDEVNIIVLFNACAQLGSAEALALVKKVWKEIPQSFHSNSHLLTSLLDALMKCGDVKEAESLFKRTPKKALSMYAAMMKEYNKNNNPMKTLNLYNEMKKDAIEGSIIIYLHVIKAVSQMSDYSICQSILKEIPDRFRVDNQLCNALIDMWGKIGHINQAKELFEKIPQPDQIGYTSMINSYGLNGQGIPAVELYRQMPQALINEVTNICVLNACSHSGLIDEARLIFENIKNKTEKTSTVMVDCLSRGSFFEEAQDLIDKYEHSNSPASSMYMALLSGARNVNNVDLSQKIYDRMKKLFPQMTDQLISAAVLLANVYASSGQINKAADIRIQLNQSGAKKKIGLSWTVINGELFQFRAHDQSHPRSVEIYTELEKISSELISHGHQYNSSWITRFLNQDETVASVLCGHSERLAIAFNFVSNPNTRRIQVTKNLRVCGDCHRATKLIALIRQCEIIVRDANRIHHFFTNGQCSCNDYF